MSAHRPGTIIRREETQRRVQVEESAIGVIPYFSGRQSRRLPQRRVQVEDSTIWVAVEGSNQLSGPERNFGG